MTNAVIVDPGARSRALAALLLGETSAAEVDTTGLAAADWAASVAASGRQPIGFDPLSVPAGWRRPLADAGVPFAVGGGRWPARIDAAEAPQLTATGELLLPSLAHFAVLTSLPLKPVRQFVQQTTGVRLQVATGVHLWLWENQFALINTVDAQRGGFVNGPRHGMRSVIALEAGQVQVLAW